MRATRIDELKFNGNRITLCLILILEYSDSSVVVAITVVVIAVALLPEGIGHVYRQILELHIVRESHGLGIPEQERNRKDRQTNSYA